MLTRNSTAQHLHRFIRNAHRLETKVSTDLDDQSGHGRMKVHVLVGIHVIERQTGRAKGCELRSDFRFELAANPREQEEPDPGSGHVRVEHRIVANESWNLDSR